MDLALTRALQGESVQDLRIRMFLPALGRDASVRIDAVPVMAAEGNVRGVVASINEVAQEALSALIERAGDRATAVTLPARVAACATVK